MAFLENEHYCSAGKGYLLFFKMKQFTSFLVFNFCLLSTCRLGNSSVVGVIFLFVCMFYHWTLLFFPPMCRKPCCGCVDSFTFAVSFSYHESSPVFSFLDI